MNCNRRDFIKYIGFLYGSVLVTSSCRNSVPSALESNYHDCLTALCNQIIPDDDYPGAVKTGAVNFIRRQLASNLDYCKEDYRRGLSALQAYCRNNFSMKFEQLSSSQQILLMKQMENNLAHGDEWNELTAKTFFEMVLKHTMMSFYGAPRHGGNKDFASFRMLRFDVPMVVGQNRYK